MKSLIYIGITIGGLIGGYVPVLLARTVYLLPALSVAQLAASQVFGPATKLARICNLP
jgi:hypothetical protein